MNASANPNTGSNMQNQKQNYVQTRAFAPSGPRPPRVIVRFVEDTTDTVPIKGGFDHPTKVIFIVTGVGPIEIPTKAVGALYAIKTSGVRMAVDLLIKKGYDEFLLVHGSLVKAGDEAVREPLPNEWGSNPWERVHFKCMSAPEYKAAVAGVDTAPAFETISSIPQGGLNYDKEQERKYRARANERYASQTAKDLDLDPELFSEDPGSDLPF